MQAAAQAKARDAQVVRAAPPKELQKRFALTQKLKWIVKAKADAARPAATMPAFNGRMARGSARESVRWKAPGGGIGKWRRTRLRPALLGHRRLGAGDWPVLT